MLRCSRLQSLVYGGGIYGETEAQTTFFAGDAVFCRNWPCMCALLGDPDTYAGGPSIKPEQVGGRARAGASSVS